MLAQVGANRFGIAESEIEMPAPLYAGPAVFDETLYIATAERLYAIGDRGETQTHR